ncbi:MAG: HK97 family phage prohead protease [Erysipelotrichaceae bacterium]|nr:HK97 family phage prohead protease [Erysipelotrichaceae bacterium]
MKNDYDFGGWATRNNIQCSDGRTIMKDAFKQNDGQKVPLVWNHQHNDPSEVLGHALLENREDGVYAYCKFNNTESGQTAKSLVMNGDVDKLSIYANKLKSQMNNVIHGCIREVSLVLAGANPGAYIDSVIVHGEGAEAEEEVIIYNDGEISLSEDETDISEETPEDGEIEHSDDANKEKEDSTKMGEDEKKEKTVQDIIDTMNDEQKEAMYAIVGQALEDQANGNGDNADEEDGGEEDMKHNVFDNDNNDEVLQHSEIIAEAMADGKKYGSLRESFLQHAAINNIENLDKLFPDATELYKEPYMIEKDNSWVAKVMNAVKHTPFSRVKTTFGRMNEETARAKGYIKGNKKANIALSVLNRVTTPTTVYIKNEIDRDDVIDITDFDVVAWQKREMRKQLDKELALAMLLGDGRDVSDQNKINEQNIRPVISDDAMYTIKYTVTKGKDYTQEGNSYSDNDSRTKGIIRAAIRSRKDYKGSGTPTFFTTEDVLTDMLLIEDQNGRRIYNNINDLATALRCKEIVTIPEMEAEAYKDIYGIIVNMADYTAGADKGGSVNMFDDFDIDYNQMKYLIETRMSGALTVPYSAIVLKKEAAQAEVHTEAEG